MTTKGQVDGEPTTHTHYGFDGPIYLPLSLSGIVTAVLGLDNRSLAIPCGRGSLSPPELQPTPSKGADPSKLEAKPTGAAGGTGDPTTPGSPGATYLYVPQASQHYNFPTSGASDQVIGIIAPQPPATAGPQYGPGIGASYLSSDITTYFQSLGSIYGSNYGTSPPLQDIPLTISGINYFNNPTAISSALPSTLTNQQVNAILGSFPGSSWIETTQDICTSATIAQGATVNVYFTENSEAGWAVYLSRVLVPGTEKQPTALSGSWILLPSGFDDSQIGPISGPGSSASTATVVSGLFQTLAGLGINVFQAAGDWGADDSVVGKTATTPHVSYPGSDPWVTCCGGTILNLSTTPAPLEWVWSDAFNSSSPFGSGKTLSDFGATGGGVSAVFPTPEYQTAANIAITSAESSAGIPITTGRFVPDIAGMVAYAGFYINNWSYLFVGTSCVAPLYAGLAAVIRQAFGVELGFLNTTFYQLGRGNSPFNDIVYGNNDSGDTPDSTFFWRGHRGIRAPDGAVSTAPTSSMALPVRCSRNLCTLTSTRALTV